MVTDPIADLLARIRNGQQRNHRAVRVMASKFGAHVLDVLKNEGFIDGYETRKDREGKFDEFEVFLRYADGRPGITRSVRVSKPGRRVYASADKLPKVHAGLGISILSTSKGVMSDREARKQGIGGEVIALIS